MTGMLNKDTINFTMKALIFFAIYIQPIFHENQPNEICSHLSEKASKGRFLEPKKLQNHSNEGKEKEKKEE